MFPWTCRSKSRRREALCHFKRISNASQQTFSQHVDPDTAYIYYENTLTGERHWDRPIEGVLPLRPKIPSPEQAAADVV